MASLNRSLLVECMFCFSYVTHDVLKEFRRFSFHKLCLHEQVNKKIFERNISTYIGTLCTDAPSPQKKSGREMYVSPLAFFLGDGASVHRLIHKFPRLFD